MSLDYGRPRRVWINNPSTLQPYHHLHTKKGIAIPEIGNFCDIHFCDGAAHSMRILKMHLTVIKISSAED